MKLILNIDTALEKACVSLSRGGEIICSNENNQQKDHASWLQQAVQELLEQSGVSLNDLSAVAVSNGPGSYTGLRIGLSSAKGYCYALQIPLITVSTLEVIAHSVKEKVTDLVCPMIDARRMEVYAAIYEKNIVEKIPPFATIINEKSFSDLLEKHPILFCGNGSKKLKPLLTHTHASFSDADNLNYSLSQLAYTYYTGNKFAVLPYAQPLYIKEFHSTLRKD